MMQNGNRRLNTFGKNNPQEAKELFRRLYNLFRGKGGHTDTFEDHPGWDKPTGADKLIPWDRLVLAAEEWKIELPGYLFISLKKLLTEQNTKNFHPHFLLNETLLAEYRKNYPTIVREIEIRWESRQLSFDAEVQSVLSRHNIPRLPAGWLICIALESGNGFDLFTYCQVGKEKTGFFMDSEIELAKFEYSLFPGVYDKLIGDETILEKLR